MSMLSPMRAANLAKYSRCLRVFNALVATRLGEGRGALYEAVRPLPLFPSGAAKEGEVVGCPKFAVVGWLQVLCEAPIEKGFHDFSFEELYLSPKGDV